MPRIKFNSTDLAWVASGGNFCDCEFCKVEYHHTLSQVVGEWLIDLVDTRWAEPVAVRCVLTQVPELRALMPAPAGSEPAHVRGAWMKRLGLALPPQRSIKCFRPGIWRKTAGSPPDLDRRSLENLMFAAWVEIALAKKSATDQFLAQLPKVVPAAARYSLARQFLLRLPNLPLGASAYNVDVTQFDMGGPIFQGG